MCDKTKEFLERVKKDRLSNDCIIGRNIIINEDEVVRLNKLVDNLLEEL